MREIRVRIENAAAMAAALINKGYQAYMRPGCKTNFRNGCNDPSCCVQHISDGNQDSWATINTDALRRQAHKIWVAAGIVK